MAMIVMAQRPPSEFTNDWGTNTIGRNRGALHWLERSGYVAETLAKGRLASHQTALS
jgi:hypothetical protein